MEVKEGYLKRWSITLENILFIVMLAKYLFWESNGMQSSSSCCNFLLFFSSYNIENTAASI